MCVPLVAALAMGIPAAPAGAADGELDPSFDGDGRVLSDITALRDNMEDLAIDPMGRIVTVGTGYPPGGGGPSRALIARYTPAGALDPSFSGDGVAPLDWSPEAESADAVAIDSKGRIVVGGSAARPVTGFDFAAARLLPDGSFDPSFSGDGKVLFDIPGGGFDVLDAITVDARDRILLAGDVSGPSPAPNYAALVRLDVGGSLDPGFDGDGILLTAFPGFAYAGADALAIDAAGRAVTGGVAADPGDVRSAAVRYTEGGGYDLGFGAAGRALLDFSALPGEEIDAVAIDAVAIDAAGRIVLAGGAGMAGAYLVDVGRLLPDGSPDPSFGNGGIAASDVVGSASATDAAIDAAGRIVVSGDIASGLSQDAFLARYTPAGALDPSFGSGGIAREDFLAADAAGETVAIDAAGRYVLGGSASGGAVEAFGLARFLTDYPSPAPPASRSSSPPAPTSSPPPPPPARQRAARCAGKRATIVGTHRRDVIRGTRRRDVIAALGGEDRVRGLGGNDLICGGRGRDVLWGGRGRDVLRGGRGADRLFGQAGRDRLFGGPGRDVLRGGPGGDRLRGGPGRDVQRER